MNAYACSDYGDAWRLHYEALRLATEDDEKFKGKREAVLPGRITSNPVYDVCVGTASRGKPGTVRWPCSSIDLALLLAVQLSPERALPLYEESLGIRRGLRDVWGVAGSLRALAETARTMVQASQARAYVAYRWGICIGPRIPWGCRVPGDAEAPGSGRRGVGC